MIHVTSLFSQLLQHFSRTEFASIVKKHNAEKDAKGFTCWNQFVSMMFCHLAHADSLREICNGLRCCLGKVKHLGINKATNKSTLSYAKVHVLLDHDHYMPSFVRITKAKEHDIKTARTLALNPGSIVAMDRAYNDYILFGPWTAKGIFFVTRLKENAVYEVVEDRPVPKNRNIISDQIIRLTGTGAEEKRPYLLRMVVVWDEENQREIYLLTNHIEFGATTIAAIYKDRWEIELFFKALKQNLKVKTFVGTSENALRIQIWTATSVKRGNPENMILRPVTLCYIMR